MRLTELIQDPVTRKRWLRFRVRRRAYGSLWLLIALYGLSLCSELICNDRPLYIRFGGRSFFPVFRYYPEEAFLGNGRKTRPDYKALRENPAVGGAPGTIMLFPVIPFGPNESIDPATLADQQRVTVTFMPAPHAGNVNVSPDLTVGRGVDAGYFFGVGDTAVKGLSLTDQWKLEAPLREAIARRFQNLPSPAVSVILTNRRDDTVKALVSLSEYEPRSSAPTTVRISFNEPTAGEGSRPPSIAFAPGGRIVGKPPELWNRADATLRAAAQRLAAARFNGPVPAERVAIAPTTYRMQADRNDITWPHAPGPGHWLGIDSAGRDVLARILYGLRVSLTFGFLLVCVSMVAGVLLGAVQGYYGGLVDITGQRLIEVWNALPFLYVMMLMGSVYGQSFVLLLVCYGLFNWIGISYYIRGEFLRLRHLPFVDAARCLGVSSPAIILRHILPNALTPVVTFFPFSLVGAIASLAALDYLGFGLPPPTPSWGQLLLQAQEYRWAWWLILYPALALFIVMLLGVFIGEGVRDAYDPRPYSRME